MNIQNLKIHSITGYQLFEHGFRTYVFWVEVYHKCAYGAIAYPNCIHTPCTKYSLQAVRTTLQVGGTHNMCKCTLFSIRGITYLGHSQYLLQVCKDWPGGMKEYWTALLLVRLPSTSYTHWMRSPSKAWTLSNPVMVVVCSVLFWTVYTAPGKAAPRTWPLSSVLLCIHSGGEIVSLCLQMRVSWFEQSPWSSRETVKAAVKCGQS